MSDEPVNTGENRKPGTFTKGDPRINRKGRPIRSFDNLRTEWQEVWAEVLFDSGGKPMIDEVTKKKLTRIKARMRTMTTSRNPKEVELALAYAYGKPKEQIDLTTAGEMKVIIEYSKSEDPEAPPSPTPGEGQPEKV